METVKGILKGRDMYWVEESESVAEVARAMSGLHVGAILVLRQGSLCGIFSERDLMKRVVVEGRDINSTKVGEVMTKDLATVGEETTLEDAMQQMHEYGCRHLPVVNTGGVIGMVSMRDLMNVELKRKTEEIEHMRAYIHGAA
jgi:signal-transduction protein with cAMP-binding, CBS, and nucleotidyltransferase domain